MEYKTLDYEEVTPGTAGVAQKISSGYKGKKPGKEINETSKLVFLMKNEVMTCSHNQY